jgi:hypothetical protein
MKRRAIAGAMLLAPVVMCGCAHAPTAPADPGRLCRVAVEDRSGPPAFNADAASGPAEVVGAAASVAVLAIMLPPFAPFLIGTALGAGLSCGASAVAYPNAEAALQAIAPNADRGTLTRALAAELDVPWAGCERASADTPGAAAADAVVQVESVGYHVVCPLSDAYTYLIHVKWRVTAAPDHRVLGERTTRCVQHSWKSVDAWPADPDYARAEIDRVLARTGQRMAAELRAPQALGACSFRSNEKGEIESP